jgi:hypothetical protein
MDWEGNNNLTLKRYEEPEAVLWQGMDWEGNNNLTLKLYEEPEARECIRTQDLPFSVMVLLTR